MNLGIASDPLCLSDILSLGERKWNKVRNVGKWEELRHNSFSASLNGHVSLRNEFFITVGNFSLWP